MVPSHTLLQLQPLWVLMLLPSGIVQHSLLTILSYLQVQRSAELWREQHIMLKLNPPAHRLLFLKHWVELRLASPLPVDPVQYMLQVVGLFLLSAAQERRLQAALIQWFSSIIITYWMGILILLGIIIPISLLSMVTQM